MGARLDIKQSFCLNSASPFHPVHIWRDETNDTATLFNRGYEISVYSAVWCGVTGNLEAHGPAYAPGSSSGITRIPRGKRWEAMHCIFTIRGSSSRGKSRTESAEFCNADIFNFWLPPGESWFYWCHLGGFWAVVIHMWRTDSYRPVMRSIRDPLSHRGGGSYQDLPGHPAHCAGVSETYHKRLQCQPCSALRAFSPKMATIYLLHEYGAANATISVTRARLCPRAGLAGVAKWIWPRPRRRAPAFGA